MSLGIENMFILRLPKDHADRVREAYRTDALRDRLKVEFNSDQRHARVRFDEETLSGKLVDLPCIIESHKTLDRKTLYKTGDLSQMLVCSQDVLDPTGEKLEDLPLSKRKAFAKKFSWSHGLTPPLKNVRKRRFRKTASKKFIDSPEIEKELKRLLREDLQAVNVSYKVVSDEGRNEDLQSVVSEVPSRSQTPGLSHELDGDSFSSSLSRDAAKNELLRVLGEASSSSSDEDDDEEDIAVDGSDDDSSHINPEVLSLQQAIQDMEMQIQEQIMKIDNTPNPILRERFEKFLLELERHKQQKESELQKYLN